MLVLGRRIHETLIIGDNIKVTILGISGNQVRIGIEAPNEVTIDREEIHLRKASGQPRPVPTINRPPAPQPPLSRWARPS